MSLHDPYQLIRMAVLATDLDLAGYTHLADRVDNLISIASDDELNKVNNRIQAIISSLENLTQVNIGSEVSPDTTHSIQQSVLQMHPNHAKEYHALMDELKMLKHRRDQIKDQLRPEVRIDPEQPVDMTTDLNELDF